MTWASETAEYIQHHRDNLSPDYISKIRQHWNACHEVRIVMEPQTWLAKQRIKHNWTGNKVLDLFRQNGDGISREIFNLYEQGLSMPSSKRITIFAKIYNVSEHTVLKHLAYDLKPGAQNLAIIDDNDMAKLNAAISKGMASFNYNVKKLWQACHNYGAKVSFRSFSRWIVGESKPRYTTYEQILPIIKRVTKFKKNGSI